MARKTVKLLLVDQNDHVLLVCGRDSATGLCHWYPVGGGIEAGESPEQAAGREAWEETGLRHLVGGRHVWTRKTRYTYSDQSYDVHETWLHYRVEHFEPAPAQLTDYETTSIVGFRWWTSDDLQETDESVYPPSLGHHLALLHANGEPASPVDIGEQADP